jgi:hypothetical protein
MDTVGDAQTIDALAVIPFDRQAQRFKAQSGGSIVCRELLAGVETTEGGDPEQRTAEYYEKRPCPNLVALAADVLDGFLREKQVIS